MLDGEALGKGRLSTSSDEDVTTTIGLHLAGLAAAGCDGEGLDVAGLLVLRGNGEDLVVVLNEVVEERRAPAEVVLVLISSGQESAQVSEVNQSALSVKVVEEGELRSGVSQGSQILDEGNLHLGTGEEHAGVPSETSLLLEEEDLWHRAIWAKLLASGDGIVHGNSHGKTGRAEAGTNQVKLGVGRGSLQVRGALPMNSGAGSSSINSSGSGSSMRGAAVDTVEAVGASVAASVQVAEAVGAVEGDLAVRSHVGLMEIGVRCEETERV